MAGGREIRAGKAYVEIGVRDRTLRGLKAIGRKLIGFAAFIGKAGLAVGSAAVAGAAIATKAFTNMGSELADASARTGASVEALSALKYAAEQTGADLSAVETGLRKMSKTLVDAATGSKSAREALKMLGLTVEDLAGMSPEEQFALIAKRLTAIKDPTTKAAAALEIFGKSGTQLLPMAAELDVLTKRAKELGLIMSTEDARSADKLGDKLSDLWKVIKQGAFVVGAQLQPIVESLTDTFVRGAVATAKWFKENPNLIRAAAQGIGDVVSWLGDRFKDLRNVLNDVSGGALDALTSGEFKIAGELVVGQLKIAFLGLSSWFEDLWNGIGNALVAAMIRGTAEAQKVWVKFQDQLKKMTNAIGDDMEITNKERVVKIALENLEKAKETKNPLLIKTMQGVLEKANQELKDVLKQAELGQSEPSAAAQAQIDALEKKKQDDLAALKDISSKVDQAERGRLGEEVVALEKQLAELRGRAKGGGPRGSATQTPLPPIPTAEDFDDAISGLAKVSSRGTFNALALQSLQGGSDPSLPILKNIEKNTATLKDGTKFTFSA